MAASTTMKDSPGSLGKLLPDNQLPPSRGGWRWLRRHDFGHKAAGLDLVTAPWPSTCAVCSTVRSCGLGSRPSTGPVDLRGKSVDLQVRPVDLKVR